MNRNRQRGVSIIMAIFMMVVLASLAGVMARLVASSNLGAAQDVMGAQARQSAIAGLEVGIYNWISAGTCSSTALTASGYQVVVTCDRDLNSVTNDTATIAIARISAISCSPGGACPDISTPNRVGYIERKVEATVSR